MTHASRKIAIHAPADAVWRLVGDFGAAGAYLAGVVQCKVEGEGIGALRTLTSADGSTIVERLESLDEGTRQLSYALLTDTPFCNCLTTVAVRELGPGQAEMEWSATFQLDGLPAGEAVELLEGAFALNGRALQRLLAASGAATG